MHFAIQNVLEVIAMSEVVSFLSIFDGNRRNVKLVEKAGAGVFPTTNFISIKVYTVVNGYLSRRYPTVSSICIFRYSRLFASLLVYNSVVSPLFFQVDFREEKLDLKKWMSRNYEWPSDVKHTALTPVVYVMEFNGLTAKLIFLAISFKFQRSLYFNFLSPNQKVIY